MKQNKSVKTPQKIILKDLARLQPDEVWYNEEEKEQIDAKAKLNYAPLFIVEARIYIPEIYSTYCSYVKEINKQNNTLYGAKSYTIQDEEVVRTIYFANPNIENYIKDKQFNEILKTAKKLTTPSATKQINIAIYKVENDTKLTTILSPFAPLRNTPKIQNINTYKTKNYPKDIVDDKKQEQNTEQKAEVQKHLKRMQEWANKQVEKEPNEVKEMQYIMFHYAKYVARQQMLEENRQRRNLEKKQKRILTAKSLKEEKEIQKTLFIISKNITKEQTKIQLQQEKTEAKLKKKKLQQEQAQIENTLFVMAKYVLLEKQKEETKERKREKDRILKREKRKQQKEQFEFLSPEEQEAIREKRRIANRKAYEKQKNKSKTKEYNSTYSTPTEIENDLLFAEIARNIQAKQNKLRTEKRHKELREQKRQEVLQMTEEEKQEFFAAEKAKREKYKQLLIVSEQQTNSTNEINNDTPNVAFRQDTINKEEQNINSNSAQTTELDKKKEYNKKEAEKQKEAEIEKLNNMSEEERQEYLAKKQAQKAKYNATQREKRAQRLASMSPEELAEFRAHKSAQSRIYCKTYRDKQKQKVENLSPEEYAEYQKQKKEKSRQKYEQRKEAEIEKLNNMSEEERQEYLKNKKEKIAEKNRQQQEKEQEKLRNMTVPERQEYMEQKRAKKRESDKRYNEKKEQEAKQIIL